jgi:myo-inositol-1(or 4)-monophosphatase
MPPDRVEQVQRNRHGEQQREILEAAVLAASDAAGILLERFVEPPAGVREKTSAVDLVSDADLAAEEAIVTRLVERFPGVPVLTEERGLIGGSDRGFRWIVDPLDGTQNYLRGIPLWCVSIAAHDERGGVVGVVHDPLHQHIYMASRGDGAWCGDHRLPLYDRLKDLSGMTLIGSFRRVAAPDVPRQDQIHRFAARFGNTRELICAALELAWTAAGRVDALYHESKIQPWDQAAGIVLCQEAGLSVTELPPAGSGLRPRLLISPPEHQETLLRGIS